MESRANAVCFALLLLIGVAGAILVIEEHTQRRRAIPREDFQRLVGGVLLVTFVREIGETLWTGLSTWGRSATGF
jgi:hypothetical protein